MQNALATTSLTPANDGFSDAAVDANAKVLRGTLVTFSDGHWHRGKEKAEIANGTRLAAVGTAHYWQKWFNKEPGEIIMREPGKPLPDRDDLGDLDEADWEMGFDGKTPKDPWNNTRALYLIDPLTAEALTFTTSSWAGRGVISDLGDQIMRMRQAHPNAIPIVELGSAPHITKFGRKTKPVLKVVEWKRGGSLVENDEPQLRLVHAETKSTKAIETANVLDDEIPF
jgi:hypothetical protein